MRMADWTIVDGTTPPWYAADYQVPIITPQAAHNGIVAVYACGETPEGSGYCNQVTGNDDVYLATFYDAGGIPIDRHVGRF